MTYTTQLTRRVSRFSFQIMTMALLGLAMLLLQPHSVQAQWTTGTNINNTNSGNVGIGTANPVWGRLQVNKSIRIDDDSASATGSDTFTAAPMLYLGTTAGGGAFQFNGSGGIDLWQYNPTVWGRSVTFAKTGSVGIGTAYPTEKLEVTGTVKSAGLTVTGAPAQTSYLNALYLGMTGNTATIDAVDQMVDFRDLVISNKTFQVKSWNGAGFVTGLFQNNVGNVGIGTTTPDLYAKLHVYNAAGAGMDIQSANAAGWARLRFVTGTHTWGWFAGDSTQADAPNKLGLYDYTAGGFRMMIDGSGNVGIGTTSPTKKLDVAGDLNASGTITAGNINAKYQDVAEWVQSSQTLSAGTVVVLDQTKSNQVIASSQAYDTRVAGVISLQPGIALGENGAGKVLVATTGRVKVKVDATAGPIHVGDLLVTSDREGVAKRSEPLNLGGVQIHRPGTLIGKALEPLESGGGEILVLLSLQ